MTMLNERNNSLPYALTGVAMALLMLGTNVVMAQGTDAIQQGANAQANGDRSIALGNDSLAESTGSMAIGERAKVKKENDNADVAGIAIGSNALVTNQFTDKMRSLLFFGQDLTSANVGELPGGIAMGTNAYANTGSIHIGMKTYHGDVAGVTFAGGDPNADHFGMTTVGTNAYNAGLFATMFGSYSFLTTDHTSAEGNAWGQNFGATVVGSLNIMKSKGFGGTAGTANTLNGFSNWVENANNTTVYGSGNKVTNSVDEMTDFSTLAPTSPDDMVVKIQAEMKSKVGGATTVIGGGNTIDWTRLTTVSGLSNTVTGTEQAPVTNTIVNGYKNKVTNSSYATVTGSQNTVTNANHLILFGDNRTVTGEAGESSSVIIGAADSVMNTSSKRVVVLGHNANATVEGGVALGAGSRAYTAKGEVGYNPKTGQPSTVTDATWVATEGAVSVGDAQASITRQITNVAAGTADTDVVNVAQLKELVNLIPENTSPTEPAPATTFSANGGNENSSNGPDGAKKNLVVTTSNNAAGGLHYDVKLADKIQLGSDPTTNQVTVDGNTSTVTLGVDAKKRIEMNGAAGIVKYGEKVEISSSASQVKAGTATMDGETSTVVGLSNTTWDANNIVSGRGATEGQLKAVAEAAQSQGAEIRHLQSDMHDARREVRDTGAMSAALAGLKAIQYPQYFTPEKASLSHA